ncbi:hypothetical protein L3X38_025524 [Prunus dulcis]|uniref:Reverse transcriptase n=1 Tax=Prunus dulcis TaxID=3755 RepID=A0AAD4Z7F1_PRUDU|nr:hypothetical protein L3X38_025524 [Prunus dulcis]
MVEKLKDCQGSLQRWNKDSVGGLFATMGSCGFDDILEAVQLVVTREMNARLLLHFRRKELEKALGQMFPTKSPGMDGMPALFYQKYWRVVGDDVTDLCLNILNGRDSVQTINHTLLTLIPKTKCPAQVTEYRPINLCTVLYKIISKTLVNRMKQIVPAIISNY